MVLCISSKLNILTKTCSFINATWAVVAGRTHLALWWRLTTYLSSPVLTECDLPSPSLSQGQFSFCPDQKHTPYQVFVPHFPHTKDVICRAPWEWHFSWCWIADIPSVWLGWRAQTWFNSRSPTCRILSIYNPPFQCRYISLRNGWLRAWEGLQAVSGV